MNQLRRTVLMVDGLVVTGVITSRAERNIDVLVEASGRDTTDLVLLRDAELILHGGERIHAPVFAVPKAAVIAFGVQDGSVETATDEIRAATPPLTAGRGS